MLIETRPSPVHWITAAMAVLCISVVAWVPILLITAPYFPPDQRIVASCVCTIPVILALLPLVIRSARSARWAVDLEGITSPSIGRISFSDIASIHSGFPRAESISMTAFQSALAPGSRSIIDQTLVLRLEDGRLLPLNLLSPTIRGGAAVMSKVEELLVGKKHSSSMFSTAEIACLKKRPLNRIVAPKNAF
jgi:hypothetical protein